MFTQERKNMWPRTEAVAFVENAEIDDWRRFKEVGLLDETAIQGRDRQALLQNISNLEKQLLDYQYNMGLVLIEKNEWTSKYDQLREEVAQLHESLKREQSAHCISIAQVEKREENLRNALASKKQCVLDLEKALRQTHAEREQIKLASEAELADARALAVGCQDKSLNQQGKSHAADAKLAEANKMNFELERKLRELEIRESVLRRERASLTAEKEVHEAIFSKHKEELREWERKLQEKEEKLREGRRSFNEREEKVNDLDVAHKQKEKRLEEEHKRIYSSNIALKKRDDDISKKVADMTKKEQKLDSYKAELEMKDKELHCLTEKLNTREREEIQTLLDERRAAFDVEQQEHKLDLNKRRNLFDRELRAKFDGLTQREMELNHLEGKFIEREQSLETELERFKEREKDIEGKSKAVKESEKFLKAEEKRLELVRKGTLSDKQSELNLKDELYKIKAEISQKELNVSEAIEKLKVSEAERAEHLRLQIELKREIQRYKHQRQLILKEGEDMKEDKMEFEKQWEALDMKRTAVTKELQQLQEEKKMPDDLRHTEDEQLRKNKLATEDYVRRECEALKLEKESFAATMKYEQLLLSEKAETEHNILLCDFEARRRDLETDLQNKQEEIHKSFEWKEKSLHDQREKALDEISSLKEVTQKEMDDIRAERIKLDNEKKDMAFNNKQLENHQYELRKDIEALGVLNKKLKEQRQQFLKERRHFLACVEKIKDCDGCGGIARDYASYNCPLREIGDNEESPLSLQGDQLMEKVASFGENFERSPAEVEQNYSDSGISWFRKCTAKILSLSPNRKALVMDSSSRPSEPCKIFGTEIRDYDIAEGPGVKHLPPENSVGGARRTPVDYQSDMDSRIQEVLEESEQSELTSGQRRPRKRSGKGIRRTHTVKAVVEEAAVFLGKNAELLPSGEHPKDISESRGDFGVAGKTAINIPRKRTHRQISQTTVTDIDANDSEGHSGSVTTGGWRKRFQPSTSAVQNPGGRRYNLRQHKIIETKIADQSAGGKKSKDAEMCCEDCALQAAGKDEVASFQAVEIGNENGSQTSLVHVTSYRSTKSQNLPVDRVVRDGIDVNGDAAKFVEKRDLRKELTHTLEYCGEDELKEHILEDEEYDESNSDEDDTSNESEQQGRGSIGRKVWQFFTS